MLKNECDNIHLPNYDKSCCLKHLLLMNMIADNQMMNSKYSENFLNVLIENFKKDQISFETMKFDILKMLLETITKYTSYLFIRNKHRFAKLLSEIAIKACMSSAMGDNPVIVKCKIGIFNNLSCIFLKEENYLSAFNYSKYALQFTQNKLDKALIFNNISKIQLKLNDSISAANSMKNCYLFILDEVERIKNERLKLNVEYIGITMLNDANLISYLYYNYGIFMLINKNIREANLIFREGYKFSMSILGENNLNTLKFIPKFSDYSNFQKSNFVFIFS